MKKNFSKKVIQEALSQELSKGLINEKISDIPSNIIGGVKNAVSAGYGAYNTGKINSQIKRSADKIGKEWESAGQVVKKAVEKIEKSNNPQVRQSAQAINKNFQDIDANIKNATAKMSSLSTSGLTSDAGNSPAPKDRNGPLLNALDDDPEDFKIQDKVTKFGNQYKESPIQRWVKMLGMDPEKIGVHEWSSLNKAYLELRNAGANPFTMSPEQVTKLVAYEGLRNNNITKGLPDSYLGTFEHYDYIFGKKLADKMRQNLADYHGVPVDKLRNAYLGDPPEDKKKPGAAAKPGTPGAVKPNPASPNPAAPNAVPPNPAATPPNNPEAPAQPSAQPSVEAPQQVQTPAAKRPIKPPSDMEMNPNNFAQELGKKPQKVAPNVSNKAPDIDPETGQDVNSMKIGNRAARQGTPEPINTTYNQMLSLLDDQDFGFLPQEKQDLKATLENEGPEVFFQKFMAAAESAQARPKVKPMDRNAPPRTPALKPKPPIPEPSQPMVSTPEEPEPEPIPLTKRKEAPSMSMPPKQTQKKVPQEPKAFSPPMNDFFNTLPVPEEPNQEVPTTTFGKMPAQDTGKEIQVGSFENPGFGDPGKEEEKPKSEYDIKKQQLLSKAKNATSEKEKQKAMNDLQDLFAKDIEASKPKKVSSRSTKK